MVAAVYGSKPSWQLQYEGWESNLEPWANRSYWNWALYLYRGNGDTPWSNAGTAFSVGGPGGVSGTFGGFRFGSTGTGTNYSGTPVGGRVLIASGGDWVYRNPDGTGAVTVSASHSTSSSLGNASIGNTVIGLVHLRQAPWPPHSVGLTYNSDSQVTALWTNQWPSNGSATVNEVDRSVNGGGWERVANISPASSLAFGAAPNQKIITRVHASNEVGGSGWSAASPPVFTTPAAPSSVAAVKDANQDIVVSWTPNVAFVEHQHVIEHSTDGGSTWSALTTVAAGTSSYKHVGPNPADTHRYRVRAVNTDASARASVWVLTAIVQLLAAPNKPTIATKGAFQDRGKDFVLQWAHNSVDTTPQSAYEAQYSVDGGAYASSGKIVTPVSQDTLPANSYAANKQLTVRVRTWGQATTGGSDGTGASPWSDPLTVTFKTRPTATVLSPADLSTWTEADLTVGLGFAQAEGASFVRATIQLRHGGVLVEQVLSTTLAATALTTRVLDGETYELTVTVLDSNGLESDPVVTEFDVAYTLPVPAQVTVTYLPDSGAAQLNLLIPAPGVGEVAAASVSISRTIDGGPRELIVAGLPVSGESMAILDLTPTIRGANTYRVRTHSEDGATVDVTEVLVTAEGKWAFLSTGPGFAEIVKFSRQLVTAAAPSRETELVRAAGRSRPIALFGSGGSLEVMGSAVVMADEMRDAFSEPGSSISEIEALLLRAAKVCYRDPTGRRMFGAVAGSFSNRTGVSADFEFIVTEVST